MDRSPAANQSQALSGSLDMVAARVEQRVARLLDAEQVRWQAVDPRLLAPLDALRDLVMAGGKRLRPTFCHWGFVAAGGDPDDPRIVDAGAAFEVLQAFALLHDDIMDGSPIRRGLPTAHRHFDEHHRREQWSGEARRFGEGVAILVGDLALVYADQLLPTGSLAVTELWNELRIELNVGQYLDLIGTASGGVGPAEARQIARLKSGRYTIERPLQLGSLLAGDPDMARHLSRYGDPLGQAFQLRDDVLGAFGEPAVTGKPVGEDLREGKPTLLLALAAEAAAEADRDLLAHVGDPMLSDAAVSRIQDLLVRSGALAAVEAEITALAAQATGALAAIDLGDEALTALVDLAAFVVSRRR